MAAESKTKTDICEYCNTHTNAYFEVGHGDRLLKVVCCKTCYDDIVVPLSDRQKKIFADAPNEVVWQNEPCDFGAEQ